MEAIGLVSNIFQIIEASWKAIEMCNQIYKHGTTIDLEELVYISDQLAQATAHLDTYLREFPADEAHLTSEVQLAALSKKVHDAAQNLRNELRSLQNVSGSGRRAAIRKAIKLILRASRIEESRKRLNEIVQVLNTRILVHFSRNVFTVMQSQNTLLQSLMDLQRRIDRNSDERSISAERRRFHIMWQPSAIQRRIPSIERGFNMCIGISTQPVELEDFLKSLHFPEIYLRQETIGQPHADTFEWIFEDCQDTSGHWHGFNDWLRSDEPLYWVLGKPGSGKSTLMNFLALDERTQAALNSTGIPTVVLSFFFWDSGVDLQKDSTGLLRSLIYQALKAINTDEALRLWYDVIRHQTGTAYLPQLFQSILRTVDRRFCLFLDGLDECRKDSDKWEAMKSLYGILKCQKNVKMCISSRPSIELKDFYGSCPNLVMQSWTESDIRQYVEDMLTKRRPTSHTIDSGPVQMNRLVDEVVLKADGVFLWVKLAVQSLLRGLRNEDDWPTLVERLSRLPPGIFHFYTHMWRRMAVDDPIYTSEAAFYLRIMQRFRRVSLLEAAIFINDDLRAQFSQPAIAWDIHHFEADVDYQKAGERLTAYGAGFLEVTYRDVDTLDEDGNRSPWKSERRTIHVRPKIAERLLDYHQSHYTTSVAFVHETALSYLRTPAGREMLQACRYAEQDLIDRYLESVLISFWLAPTTENWWQIGQRFGFVGLCSLEKIQAIQFLSQLEDICKKFFAWNLWNLGTSDLPRLRYSSEDQVDFAKAFISFSHPEYTRWKIIEANQKHNQEYLTELLIWLTATVDFHIHLDSLINNGLLLLHLGADPNKSILESKPCALTLWIVLLLEALNVAPRVDQTTSTLIQIRDLIRGFLRAGADPNACVTGLLARQSHGEMWNEVQRPDLSKAFLLCRWSALDMIESSLETPSSDLPCLLLEEGAVSAQKGVLLFEPPNTWRVFPQHSLAILDLSYTWGYRAGQVFSDFSFEIEDETLDSVLRPGINERDINWMSKLDQSKNNVFSNGVEAFMAAGWTIEEIGKDFVLSLLWEEIQRVGLGIHIGQEDVLLQETQLTVPVY